MPQPSRASFDIPDDVAYLNCAYLSPLPKAVTEAGQRAVLRKARPWEILYNDFFEEVEALRAAFASLIGAGAGDVAIVSSSAYGISTAAANLELAPGDNIVVAASEHASTFHRWRIAAGRHQAELREASPAASESWGEAIAGQIDRRTRAVSVPHVHWSDGALFDLEMISQRARAAGAELIIDGTQSIGALPLRVSSLQPDYIVCSAYKWLLCPYGFAFLYVAPKRQGGFPFEEHYFNRQGAEDHEGKLQHLTGYARGARRFDTAERANFITVPMSIMALEMLARWSVAEIQRLIAPISEAIVAGASRLGYRAAETSMRSPHLFGLRRENGLPAGLAGRLRADSVFVSIRGDAIRVSPHVFNTEADADRFIKSLEAAGRN